MYYKFIMGVFFLSLTLFSPLLVDGKEIVDFKNVEIEEGLRPLGRALKKFFTVPVVTVDLYIEEGHSSQDVLGNILKRLEVNYHVNIAKKELDHATVKGIRKNVTPDEFKALKLKIDQVNSYYRSVHPGDQIAITYIPGLGSRVQINGEVKGVVPGEDFGKAFFAIWVGEHPVDKKAKRQLLGK
jgi:hypothetical protein